MVRKSNLYDEATWRLKELQNAIVILENELEKAPKGKICIKKDKNRVQFYLRSESKEKLGKYIRACEQKVLKEYICKSYNEKVLKYMKQEENEIRRFLIKSNGLNKMTSEIYSTYPENARKYISPIDITDEEYVSKWENVEFTGKTIEGVRNDYITDKGENVRSKSELNIANALYKKGVPYRYEAPLKLKSGVTIYPDFTILDIQNRKNVYWEHRGMMDDRDYLKHTVKRLKDYTENNIFLWDNLVITEETSNISLGTKEINKIIDSRFIKC